MPSTATEPRLLCFLTMCGRLTPPLCSFVLQVGLLGHLGIYLWPPWLPGIYHSTSLRPAQPGTGPPLEGLLRGCLCTEEPVGGGRWQHVAGACEGKSAARLAPHAQAVCSPLQPVGELHKEVPACVQRLFGCPWRKEVKGQDGQGAHCADSALVQVRTRGYCRR